MNSEVDKLKGLIGCVAASALLSNCYFCRDEIGKAWVGQSSPATVASAMAADVVTAPVQLPIYAVERSIDKRRRAKELESDEP